MRSQYHRPRCIHHLSTGHRVPLAIAVLDSARRIARQALQTPGLAARRAHTQAAPCAIADSTGDDRPSRKSRQHT
eukprot:950490-Rhodomonas_salina.2